MVDYIMHVLVRYYESAGNRTEKVMNTLRTMGSSVLIGGISTFLGVTPLLFSTSDIFKIVFIGFVGLVTLGMGHGLILLPVVLSIVGTEDQIHHPIIHSTEAPSSDAPSSEAPISDAPNSLPVSSDDDSSEGALLWRGQSDRRPDPPGYLDSWESAECSHVESSNSAEENHLGLTNATEENHFESRSAEEHQIRSSKSEEEYNSLHSSKSGEENNLHLSKSAEAIPVTAHVTRILTSKDLEIESGDDSWVSA